MRGVVFQVTERGREPLPEATVYVTDMIDGPYFGFGGSFRTDLNGEFLTFNLPAGRAFKITAVAAGEVSPFASSNQLYQLRAVRATSGSNEPLEVELVPNGALPSRLDSPVLTGVVFQLTPDGRQPVANVGVIYSSNGHDGFDVYGRTDSQGRYRFWNIPVGSGYVWPQCKAFTTDVRSITLHVDGDTTFDVDCP